jgi:subfamily B ATP-binding cassette protein MsbA
VKPIEGNLTGFKAYRALLSLAFEHKLYFLLAFIGMIIFAATDAAFAYMMKPLMDEGFIDRDPKIIKLIPFAIVALFMVRMVAVFLRSYCMSYIGRHVINTLRRMMFEKLLTMTSDEYDQSSSASIVARFSYDVEQVSNDMAELAVDRDIPGSRAGGIFDRGQNFGTFPRYQSKYPAVDGRGDPGRPGSNRR